MTLYKYTYYTCSNMIYFMKHEEYSTDPIRAYKKYILNKHKNIFVYNLKYTIECHQLIEVELDTRSEQGSINDEKITM